MKDYYNDPGVRKLCHAVKNGETEAIYKMSEYFIRSGVLTPSSVIIPAPQHTGKAEYTLQMAYILREQTGCKIADIIRCKPHEPLYFSKQRGFLCPPEFVLCGSVPKTGDLFFLDNVYDTGTTYKTACRLIRKRLKPLIYAKVKKKEEKDVTLIYKLTNKQPIPEKVAEYALPPKKAMVCFIEQMLKGNYQTWQYPEVIKGMRESNTSPDHWYYDTTGEENAIYAAYPA